MPTLVIHALGQDPQKAAFDTDTITVGREVDNDLVLPSGTVSRHHGVIEKKDGHWVARCVSGTNPLVVGTTLTRSETDIAEGTEILFGAEYLVIFVEKKPNVPQYMGGKRYYSRVDCPECGWGGMISAVNASPVCPACGNQDLKFLDAYDKEKASGEIDLGSTAAVDTKQARRVAAQLMTAKRSHLERIDDQGGPGRADLTEDRSLTIAKGGSGMQLKGMSMGGGLQVTWDGSAYEVESLMTFPAMKVNGVKVKTTKLKNGDLIELGRNRFKFVTE